MAVKNIKIFIPDITKVQKLENQLNTERLKVETLEEVIKDELYKTFMDKLKESSEINRLKRENKNLREKVKVLKKLLKGDK